MWGRRAAWPATRGRVTGATRSSASRCASGGWATRSGPPPTSRASPTPRQERRRPADDAAERTRLLETLGADPEARTQPPHVRAQLAALEKEQKARATRFGRDVVDRSLVDLLSMYRDALVVRAGARRARQRRGHSTRCERSPSAMSAERLLACMDAIGEARERINLNVPPLALEAMAVSLQVPTPSSR
jgi:DNA polymerase-3 subunit delta'